MEDLLAAGDRLQVNASSLTGYHGAGARAAALDLVATGARRSSPPTPTSPVPVPRA